jgi:hypothetical protein
MRQLYADMYRSTEYLYHSRVHNLVQLYMYLMPLDINLFLEFHRSECQLDLQRAYVFKDTVRRPRGFKKTGSNL